ncbi:hypothetical protein I79_006219 [Cricetulus griseus]|uniref:Uncharacterized protein n=1 Tax=Cricetulus griseus TaxID=10029 RepID=G3H790_CRIGR|nr:hypothetical protein I79_006219 [Cricetulus griseus]
MPTHIMNKNSSLETRRLFLVLDLPPATMNVDRSSGLLGPLILLARKWVELEAHESPFGPDTLPSYESLWFRCFVTGTLKKEQSAARAQSSQGILLLEAGLMTFSRGAM